MTYVETDIHPRPPAPGRPAITLGADTLTAADVADYARGPDRDVVIDAAAGKRIDAAVELMRTIIDTGQPMYGITTGFGDSCIRQISPRKVVALQHNLVQYHLNGVGPD